MERPGTFLLVCIPELGHLTPMLGTARGLRSRGHRVYLASFEHARPYVTKNAPGVRFMTLGRSPLGDGGGDGEMEVHRKISDPKTSMKEQFQIILDMLIVLYQGTMFQGLAHHLVAAGCDSSLLPDARAAVLEAAAVGQTAVDAANAAPVKSEGLRGPTADMRIGGGGHASGADVEITVSSGGGGGAGPGDAEVMEKPDVIVYDSGTVCGLEAAEMFQLPVVMHNIVAGLGVVLNFYGLQRVSHAKDIPFEDYSLGVYPTKMSVWQRHVSNPFLKWLGVKLLRKMYLPEVNKRRAQFNLAKISSLKQTTAGLRHGHVVVSALSWVTEVERPLPPNWHMVGPVGFDTKHIPQIEDAQVAAFLDGARAAGEKVIYVALGTLAFLTADQVKALARAMSPPHAPPGVRYLWSLRPHLQPLLQPQDVPDAAKVMILPWVQQVPVLFHPSVCVFLSHGGMGSTNEGLAAGRPLLVMPFLGDQPINAQHIVNIGAGLALSPKRMTTERVAKRLKRLLQYPHFTQAAASAGAKLRATDGAQQAASIIEAMVGR